MKRTEEPGYYRTLRDGRFPMFVRVTPNGTVWGLSWWGDSWAYRTFGHNISDPRCQPMRLVLDRDRREQALAEDWRGLPMWWPSMEEYDGALEPDSESWLKHRAKMQGQPEKVNPALEAQAVLRDMARDPNTRDEALGLIAEVLGEVASTITPRVVTFRGTEGEPPLRVEIYKGDLAVRRGAQYAAQKRAAMGLRSSVRIEEDWT